VSPVTSGSLEDRLNSYINPTAFSTAPQFTFGNLGRTHAVVLWAERVVWQQQFREDRDAGEFFEAVAVGAAFSFSEVWVGGAADECRQTRIGCGGSYPRASAFIGGWIGQTGGVYVHHVTS
jgi:hypothetical protein